MNNSILFPKLFWPAVRKNDSTDWEKLLKFEAEGQEFARFLRSQEQLIRTVKAKNNFEKEYFFNLFLEVSQILYIRTIMFQIGKNNWDLETYRKR